MNNDLPPSHADAPAQWSPNFGYLPQGIKDWPTDRPMRIAVLGDFSASVVHSPALTGPALAQAARPFAVEFDSVDALLARLAPRLHLPLGPNGTTVEIGFNTMEDFHPDALFDRLEIFRVLASLRSRLLSPSSFAGAAAELMHIVVPAPELAGTGSGAKAQAQAGRTASGVVLPSDARLSDFARLVGGPAAAERVVDSPIDALLRHVVAPHVQPAADPRRDELVASVDACLADLMRSVLHHPQFQALESLWRGLDFMLRRIETGADLSVHVMDVSALAFAADLVASDDLSASALYQLLVERPFGDVDGGYSWVLGCYQFDATPAHAELLGRIAGIAQCADCVFISGVQAAPFAVSASSEAAPHPLTAYAWQALRALGAADHLALVAPHFMLRYPYGRRSDPIERFAFEEFNEHEGLRALLWGHAGWLLASVLARPDAQDHDAVVDELPFHFALDRHGDQVALPCTDQWVGSDAATRLAQQGLVGVVGRRGLPQVTLAPLQTLAGQTLQGKRQRRRGQPFGTAASPRGALSAVLEAEFDKLLAVRAAPADSGLTRDPGLDALIAGSGG